MPPAPTPPLAEARPASARDRILHTAHALFYGQGIRATGIDRVIAEAGVTKVTFYRHFPSKHALVLAYLAHRHALWLAWFEDALRRHGGQLDALAPALADWFNGADFRGCAFLNAVGELGSEHADILALSRDHKAAMARAIAALLPDARQRKAQAEALALAVDGAIVHVQMGVPPRQALKALARLCAGLVVPT